jgi:integrase
MVGVEIIYAPPRPAANPKVVQRMVGHASAAMTLDVYADLFDSDLDVVAVTVSKMWPRQAN